MNSAQYHAVFQTLRTGGDPAAWTSLARQTAFSFLDHCYYNDHYEPEYIRLLCEMSLAVPDPQVNKIGTAALFGIVIEELCDDYEDFQFDTYSRAMAQILEYCRRLPQGRRLDEQLNAFGLTHSDMLLERFRRIHFTPSAWRPQSPVEKIIILSRITIGADVAVVSVLLQRLLQAYPRADALLLGDEKIAGLFAGHPRIRVCPLAYPRRGGLLQRFDAWHVILEILAREIPPGSASSVLLVDPDSRLSQLGMLPLGNDQNYLYFDTHDASRQVRHLSMAELANTWLDSIVGPSAFCYPRVWPAPAVSAHAQTLLAAPRRCGCQRIVTVNFGVGGNERKRLGIGFETELVRRLLATPHTMVILDEGFGPEEVNAAQAILAAVGADGKPARVARLDNPADWSLSEGVLAVSCSIGAMAALIGGSDEFIGYDSACQHIAAALQIPTITVFAGTNNPRFIRRWKACSPGPAAIVHVNAFRHDGSPHDLEVVARILQERSQRAGPPPAEAPL